MKKGKTVLALMAVMVLSACSFEFDFFANSTSSASLPSASASESGSSSAGHPLPSSSSEANSSEGGSSSSAASSSSSGLPFGPGNSSSSGDSSSSSASSSSSSSGSSGDPYVPSGYDLAWSDEFDGDAVDGDKWAFQTGDGSDYGIWAWGNNEKEYYQKDNATVSDGCLSITAKKENVANYPYTSARMRTYGKKSWTYGFFTARMSLPGIVGSWPAFWMLPVSSWNGKGWPWSGEIDIMENMGGSNGTVFTTVHTGLDDSSGSNANSHRSPVSDAASFHEYSVLWDVSGLRFYTDGSPTFFVSASSYATYSGYGSGDPFDVPFYLILNLAIGGNFVNNATPNDAEMPCTMKVDYVRVYQK